MPPKPSVKSGVEWHRLPKKTTDQVLVLISESDHPFCVIPSFNGRLSEIHFNVKTILYPGSLYSVCYCTTGRIMSQYNHDKVVHNGHDQEVFF